MGPEGQGGAPAGSCELCGWLWKQRSRSVPAGSASLSLRCPVWKPQATQPACHWVAVRVKSVETPYGV